MSLRQFRLAALVAPLCALATAAQACGGLDLDQLKHKAAFTGEAGGAGAYLWRAAATPSMVGMWSIKFFTPDNHLFDFGYTQWHSDGTEFLNSGSRKPAWQNYCLGVWKKTGDYTYRLNHFAIGYDDAGNHVNDVNIHEFIRLDPGGNTFDGSFEIDVYDLTHTRIAQVGGTLTGSRIVP